MVGGRDASPGEGPQEVGNTDWLLVSAERGGQGLRRSRELKAMGVHFQSLWLTALAGGPLAGFAVRDRSPKAEGGRKGVWP